MSDWCLFCFQQELTIAWRFVQPMQARAGAAGAEAASFRAPQPGVAEKCLGAGAEAPREC